MADVQRFIQLLNRIYVHNQQDHHPTSTISSEEDSFEDDDVTPTLENAVLHDVFYDSGSSIHTPLSVHKMVSGRERNGRFSMFRDHSILGKKMTPFSERVKTSISQRFFPNALDGTVEVFNDPVFCSLFNNDGDLCMVACKDNSIVIYDTDTWRMARRLSARDITHSIISTDFSPNGEWLIYSSWSNLVHIANTKGEHETHEALDMKPESGRFCLFSIAFSPDSREILGGSSDRHLYIYDLDRRERVSRIGHHDDDINAVAFADDSNQVFYSGSDDSLIKIWDRRADSERSVGILPGHTEGITFIDSKKDGRSLISNGKDQCIKLWDIRNMKDKIESRIRPPSFYYNSHFGESQIESIVKQNRRHPDDQSIMTFRGPHRILQTLIRCKFSPESSTGQKYIYTGSSDGNVYVYDILSGNLVNSLSGHQGTVRDMHWHPYLPMMVTASFDGTVKKWSHAAKDQI